MIPQAMGQIIVLLSSFGLSDFYLTSDRVRPRQQIVVVEDQGGLLGWFNRA